MELFPKIRFRFMFFILEISPANKENIQGRSNDADNYDADFLKNGLLIPNDSHVPEYEADWNRIDEWQY